jgi:Flp pilus assembly protein TadD
LSAAEARTLFDAADFKGSLQAAMEGLGSAPDDVELLILAGRAGVEVEAPDAVAHLRRATELAPDNAAAWHHLGEALAAEGQTAESDGAFRKAVELDPEDEIALTHLGHTALAAGRERDGVGYLAQAADMAHSASTAAISLVEMYRTFGQYEEALQQARQVAQAAPDDALAWLDVAELSLQLGQLDEARAAFDRLRDVDDVPGHEAYPLHGMIDVEIRREGWQNAEALTQQASTIDARGLTTDVSAFLREQIGGPAEQPGDADEPPEPAPTRAEVEAALASSLADYRRMLAEERRLRAGDVFG